MVWVAQKIYLKVLTYYRTDHCHSVFLDGRHFLCSRIHLRSCTSNPLLTLLSSNILAITHLSSSWFFKVHSLVGTIDSHFLWYMVATMVAKSLLLDGQQPAQKNYGQWTTTTTTSVTKSSCVYALPTHPHAAHAALCKVNKDQVGHYPELAIFLYRLIRGHNAFFGEKK